MSLLSDQIYNMVERKGDVQGFKYCMWLRIKMEESERLMRSLKRTRDTFSSCKDDDTPTDVSPNKKPSILRPLYYLSIALIIPDRCVPTVGDELTLHRTVVYRKQDFSGWLTADLNARVEEFAQADKPEKGLQKRDWQ